MVRVAINGFGRIGRLALRLMAQDKDFKVVAINTNSDAQTLAYLLKYDTAHGNFMTDKITHGENLLVIDGNEIVTSSVKDPENCNWKELDIDLVIDCTGIFNDKEKAEAHIRAGAKKVLLSAPAKGNLKTIVYNVNHDILDGTETVISAASCTTNCLAPLAKALNDEFGIEKGLMTTVHAYTNDQNIHDNSHKKGIMSANETMAYTEDPIVSSDVIGSHYACIFDALSTQILESEGKQLVKLIAWYDNEMSFTAQLVRLAKYWGSMK